MHFDLSLNVFGFRGPRESCFGSCHAQLPKPAIPFRQGSRTPPESGRARTKRQHARQLPGDKGLRHARQLGQRGVNLPPSHAVQQLQQRRVGRSVVRRPTAGPGTSSLPRRGQPLCVASLLPRRPILADTHCTRVRIFDVKADT